MRVSLGLLLAFAFNVMMFGYNIRHYLANFEVLSLGLMLVSFVCAFLLGRLIMSNANYV